MKVHDFQLALRSKPSFTMDEFGKIPPPATGAKGRDLQPI